MEIRRIGLEAWEALRELRLRALAGDPDAFGMTLEAASAQSDAGWREWIGSPERGFFVAVADDGRFVGMAVGAPIAEQETTAGLFGMWVVPDARRHGVGAALIEAVEDWARHVGHGSIRLGVTLTNPSAIRFYERMGYADIGERHPLRDGSDLTIQVMGKAL